MKANILGSFGTELLKKDVVDQILYSTRNLQLPLTSEELSESKPEVDQKPEEHVPSKIILTGPSTKVYRFHIIYNQQKFYQGD